MESSQIKVLIAKALLMSDIPCQLAFNPEWSNPAAVFLTVTQYFRVTFPLYEVFTPFSISHTLNIWWSETSTVTQVVFRDFSFFSHFKSEHFQPYFENSSPGRPPSQCKKPTNVALFTAPTIHLPVCASCPGRRGVGGECGHTAARWRTAE